MTFRRAPRRRVKEILEPEAPVDGNGGGLTSRNIDKTTSNAQEFYNWQFKARLDYDIKVR
jgi:hypothetical protein